MKLNQNLSPYYLTGNWRITAFYLNTNLGWKLTKQYGLGSFLWEFTHDWYLIEKRNNSEDLTTLYDLDCLHGLLTIDRSNVELGDILSLGSRYRVELINHDECWVYDVDGLTPQGESKYRMKIKRLLKT